MTLYEEYKNGLNLVVYCEKAYQVLKKAVYMTALAENIYDERDIAVIWEAIIYQGNIDFITEKNGARDLIKDAFKTFDNFIDSRLLAMVRDYEKMSISDFLFTYLEEKKVNRENDRIIKSFNLNDLEFMDCASVTGLRRKNNEDFACCIQSHINDKYKLLIVCDGLGGFNKGQLASQIVAEQIINWFNTYDFAFGFTDIEIPINQVIKQAKYIMNECSFMSATTLTFAIVGETETFIGNVGDSRTYIIKDSVLKQITEDDSEVWEDFYKGKNGGYKKDDLRFIPDNNIITNAIDNYIHIPTNLRTYMVLNTLYDGILLVSDGVTDVLSDIAITKILNDGEKQDILDRLLLESCYCDPDFPKGDYDEVLYPTLPGGDNASAAIYLKRLDKGKKIV